MTTDTILASTGARVGLILLLVTIASPAYAAQYSLSVVNGSGGGSYEASTTVHIAANPYESIDGSTRGIEPADPDAPIRVFDRWIGDTGALEDPYASRTRLTMPLADITVMAQYKDGPRWLAPRVVHYVPSYHTGVVFLFHGHLGSAAGMFSSSEARSLFDDLITSGYAVVALDSYDRVELKWDTDSPSGSNVDMQRVAALWNELIDRDEISALDPIYFVGASNGGKFAAELSEQATAAFGFDVVAQAIYVHPADSDVMATTTVPTFYALAENDLVVDNSRAVTNFGRLLDRGVPAQLHMHKAEPVHPDRFWAIENLTQSDSHAIYDGLVAAGFLDAEDYLIPGAFDDTDSDGKADWTDVVPEDYVFLITDIGDLLEASFAGHGFFSNANKKVLDFFQNPVALVDLVPVIDDLSPTSDVEGRLVTITGSNLVGIHSVKFNGVEAEFEISKETTLYAIVPPGASSGTIVVSNDAGDAESPMVFEVPAAPNIDAYVPKEGPVGTEVTITGIGFTGTSIVRLGTIDTTFVVDSDTQIRAVVPAGSVTSKFGFSAPGGIAIGEDRFRVQ